MPLQASGPISISQIRTELINVNASYSLRTLSSAAGKSVPDAMSEFYGYSACPPNGTFYTSFCSGYDLYYKYHNGSCGYYDTLIEYSSPSCGCVPYEQLCGSSCTSCTNYQELYGDGYCNCYRQLNYGYYGDPEKKLLVNCYTYVSKYCLGYNQYQAITYRCNSDASTTFTDVIVSVEC